jgi:hypothetical protein
MDFSSIITAYRKVNASLWIEWIVRLFISVELIHTDLMMEEAGENFYPDVCVLMIFIAIWCYFFRLKLVGLIPLIYSALFHYWHTA